MRWQLKEDSTDLDHNVPEIEALLNFCLGLVAVNEEGPRFRLIHLTLQEYLDGRPDLFRNAHSKMAHVCLTFLNFQSIKDLPSNLLKPPETTPFLDYAWGAHAKKELIERTKTLALKLLYQYDPMLPQRCFYCIRGP